MNERRARSKSRRRSSDAPVRIEASAGGVVCAGCEAGSFPLGQEAHRFLMEALSRPLAEVPDAPERALQQADRALAETMEYHAHVRLRRVA